MAFSDFVTLAYAVLIGVVGFFNEILEALEPYYMFLLFMFFVGLVIKFFVSPLIRADVNFSNYQRVKEHYRSEKGG